MNETARKSLRLTSLESSSPVTSESNLVLVPGFHSLEDFLGEIGVYIIADEKLELITIYMKLFLKINSLIYCYHSKEKFIYHHNKTNIQVFLYIYCKTMDILINALWNSSHRNLLALAYTKMGLYQEI